MVQYPTPEPAAIRPGTPQRLAYLYRRRLIETGREDRFLVWASFTASFLTVRFITHSIRAGRFRRLFHNVTGKGGLHIHHLVFGITGLLAGGFVLAARHPAGADARRALAVLYGASAALTIDEFALWLDLEDVYWAKQGRVSVDAAIVTAALMGASVAGQPLFLALGRDAAALWRRVMR